MSDHRETLYGKGDLRRHRDGDILCKCYDAIKWDSEKDNQEKKVEDDNA